MGLKILACSGFVYRSQFPLSGSRERRIFHGEHGAGDLLGAVINTSRWRSEVFTLGKFSVGNEMGEERGLD